MANIVSAGQDLATTGLLSDLPQNIQTVVAGAVLTIESAIHDLKNLTSPNEIPNLLTDLSQVTGDLASIESAIGDLTPAGIQNLLTDLKVTNVVASINQCYRQSHNCRSPEYRPVYVAGS